MVNNRVPVFISTHTWERAHYYMRIRRAVEYLEQHVSEPVNLEKIASVANMEKTAFSKSFKHKTGTTFRDFTQAYRISAAVAKMRMCDDSLLEIALDVGFSNLTTFERTFRKVTGDLPSRYRSQLLANHPGTTSPDLPTITENKPKGD